MNLQGKRIRYVVPDTKRRVWEGIVELDDPRTQVVRVLLTTKGYEGYTEWVPYHHILRVLDPPAHTTRLEKKDPDRGG